MDPIDYFRLRYYERWLGGVTQLLIDKGYLSEEELASRTKELMANDAPWTTTRPRRNCWPGC